MAGRSSASRDHTTSSKGKAGRSSRSRSTGGGSKRATSGASGKRSKTSASRKTSRSHLSRPIDPATQKKAVELAKAYHLVLTEEPEVGYLGRTVEMPLVMADGESIEACANATLEATTAAIATLLEQGERPPAPARHGKRDQQVNIRLTGEERMRLEEAARRDGFRSLSDYLRASGLMRAG